MPVNADDFDVFVLTFNRSRYLTATLDSILAQSIGPVRITILDNASTDDTGRVIAPYMSKGVRYLRAPENIGWKGNLAKAQQLAKRPWVMAFHDDDLMHPDYLAEVARVVESVPNVALVGSAMTFESEPSLDNWPQPPRMRPVICPRPADLARMLYLGFPLHFGSAVYRTTVFRGLSWREEYGKIADRPLLLDATGHGAAIVLNFPFIRYRVHEGQDSGAAASGPFFSELSALHALYRNLLGTSILTRNGHAFLSQFVSRLEGEFHRLSSRDRQTFTAPEDYISAINAATRVPPAALWISRIYRTTYTLLRRAYKYLRRQ